MLLFKTTQRKTIIIAEIAQIVVVVAAFRVDYNIDVEFCQVGEVLFILKSARALDTAVGRGVAPSPTPYPKLRDNIFKKLFLKIATN